MSQRMKQVFAGWALEAVLAAARRPPSNEDSLADGASLGGLRRSFVTAEVIPPRATCAAAYNRDLTECGCPFCGSDRRVEAQSKDCEGDGGWLIVPDQVDRWPPGRSLAER